MLSCTHNLDTYPEDYDPQEAEAVLAKLNHLMQEYTRTTIGKLRPSPDNTLEFRVEPLDQTQPYSFDGLSSGQKEIISTLFLIWHHSRKQPAVILIDEPELHLNVEWQGRFVRWLRNLAPHNQYLIATHSEDVFASVLPDRRLILRAG